MTNEGNDTLDIGREFMRGIYTNTDIETKEAQPIYILQRDTVKTFLHEKIEAFGVADRVLGYVGIEITLIASLVTASFNDWWGLKGNIIEGTFIAFAIIVAVLIIKDGICCLKNRGNFSVDVLAEDLGGRGSIIKPSGKQQLTTGST